MLTLNQCRRYKEWGFSQKLPSSYRSDNWYMIKDGSEHISNAETAFAYGYQYDEILAIPSLQEQLAFAFEACQKRCCKRDRHYAYVSVKKQYREIKGEWKVVTVVEGAWRWPSKEGNCLYGFITPEFTDPDPQQCLYKLTEYIEGSK